MLGSTGVYSLDRILGGDGYPDRSSILVIGPPGVGKEALGYWFIHSGLVQNDYCLYVTHRPVSDVLRDMTGMGIPADRAPDWFSSSGSPARCDIRDSAAISFNIKQLVHKNKERRVKVVTDVLSPLLVLNQIEPMYNYWSQLLSDLKQQDSVVLALAEDGMHSPTILTTMEQLFDGVIEMRLYEEGLAITPLFRVKKMLSLPPIIGYFRFSISNMGMEILPYAR